METADTREPDDLGSARRLRFSVVSQEGHPPLMWIPARADLRQVPVRSHYSSVQILLTFSCSLPALVPEG